MAEPSVWPWPEWPLSGDPISIPDQEQDDLRVPEEAGDDAADGPGAGRRHHRVPPVRDRAQGGHHLHQGGICSRAVNDPLQSFTVPGEALYNALQCTVKQFGDPQRHNFYSFWATEMVLTSKWGRILQEMQC